MSFSLSNGVITQSGTDANLSGLSSISGVTTITNGTQTVYNVGNLRISVTGNLTIDPEIEELSFGTSAPYPMVGVTSTGTLQIGFEYDVGGTTPRYSAGTWARFARQSASTSSDSQSALRVETGGTLHWYGGAMFCKAQVAFMAGSNVTIYSQQAQLIWQVPGNIRQLRMLSSLADIRGFVTKGGFVTFIANPTAWSGWAPFDANAGQAFSFSSTSPDNVFYVLENFDPSGMDPTQYGACWSDSWCRLVNGAVGSAFVPGGNSDNNSNNKGLFELRQHLTVQVVSFSGGSAAGVKMRMVDTNNGNRLAANQIESNPDYTADRVYTHTFDSSGEHTFDTDGGILICLIHRRVGGLRLEGFTFDRRSTLDDTTDTFRQVFAGYLYNIGVFDTSLVGLGGTTLNATLFDDPAITETTEATALAYTTQETSARAYDHLKALLVRDFAGETELTCTKNGNTLDFGSLDVTINGTTTGEAVVTSSSVTLYCSTFTGNITTTGTVTFTSATIDGIVTDSSGTTGVLELN